ncbi:MAG: hypothetical protein E6I80_09625 [Chloroflexi bacterium]|nr:MAG: hypothetical protein E6I80_09625 [Chloroflexota bacterium]
MEEAVKAQWSSNERKDDLHFFPLEGLLPAGQALSVNTAYLVISLVSTNSVSGNPILLQRLMTELQMRLLLPLLESPHYCPHEVLYASLFYSYRGLLAGLFSSDCSAREEWQTTIEEKRVFLQRAHESGSLKRDLKPLYNALSKLRSKLRPFGLEIAISTSRSAYALISLPVPRQ